jgi:outer membrane protein
MTRTQGRKRFSKNFSFVRKSIPLGIALWGATWGVQAQSLVDLYTAARGYDATYQSAKAQYDATIAKGDQSLAGIYPTANLGAAASQTSQDSSLSSLASRNYNTQSATVSVSQPLYRPGNWATYEQGKKQIEVAQAQLSAADQDLIVRVSQAYFDVLASADSLTYVRSLKTATAEQLASAKRNFEVGTATIVDARDAQAKYDLVIAQELAADNDLRVKSLALDQLVGRSNTAPKPLQTPAALGILLPDDVDQWVRDSETNSPVIKQLKTALDVAKLETQKAEAGHKPTLDLNGSYSTSNNGGSSTVASNYNVNTGTIGLSFNLPLFAGYSVQNRVKETLALEEKAKSDLEATRRSTAQTTRTAFFGVKSGLSQVKAYEAAEASSQSALESNKLGYQVGVKINIDVLNSQSQLYDTKAKLSKARYDVLVGGLKLRQAVGTLNAADLQPINAQLSP